VKANWHLESLDFSGEIEDPMQVGVMVDVGRSEEELAFDLRRLIDKEAGFYNVGLECSRKADPRHVTSGGAVLSCYACPLYQPYGPADRSDNGIGCICQIGREQEDILAMFEAIKRTQVGSLDEELALHFAVEIESSAELAEVALA
jgi:cold shock CspA family protein